MINHQKARPCVLSYVEYDSVYVPENIGLLSDCEFLVLSQPYRTQVAGGKTLIVSLIHQIHVFIQRISRIMNSVIRHIET